MEGGSSDSSPDKGQLREEAKHRSEEVAQPRVGANKGWLVEGGHNLLFTSSPPSKW